MTTQELIDYYSNLLILQYKGKPKALATIQALVKPSIMDQLPFAVRDAFGVDTAIGVQLDVIGKYAGVSRIAKTFTETIVLDDADYRTLIKLKIAQNNSGSSLYDIQRLLWEFLDGALQVFDYQNMSLSYIFDAAFGSEQLAEVFVRQGILPKPMGVQLASLIYTANLDNIFCFATYETGQAPNTSGFNDYAIYATDHPWLTYENVIF